MYCTVHMQIWFYTFCPGSIIQTFDGWYVHSCPYPLVRTHCTCDAWNPTYGDFEILLKNPLVISILDEVIRSLSDQAKLAENYTTTHRSKSMCTNQWRTSMMDLTPVVNSRIQTSKKEEFQFIFHSRLDLNSIKEIIENLSLHILQVIFNTSFVQNILNSRYFVLRVQIVLEILSLVISKEYVAEYIMVNKRSW